ncbi:MAG: hypothetical protein V8R16_04980 [Bacilli bacterium]
MKKPAIYGIIGACAFSGASGWTYYKLYTQDGKFNTSSSFDIDDEEEEDSPSTKLLNNLMKSSIEAESMNIKLDSLGGKDLSVNFKGALDYDGMAMVQQDFSSLAGSGLLSVEYGSLKESLSFTYDASNKIYVSFDNAYVSIEMGTISSIFDLMPLFGIEMPSFDLSGQLENATSILESLKEEELEDGYLFRVNLPSIGTINLKSNKDFLLTNIYTPNKLNINGQLISIDAKVKQSVNESLLPDVDTSNYVSIDKYINATKKLIEEQKFSLDYQLNLVDNDKNINLNGNLTSNFKNKNFKEGMYSFSINNDYTSIKSLFDGKDIYLDVNNYTKTKLKDTTLEKLIFLASKKLNNIDQQIVIDKLNSLLSGSAIEEILKGNYSSWRKILTSGEVTEDYIKTTISCSSLNLGNGNVDLIIKCDKNLSIELNNIEFDNKSLNIELNLNDFNDFDEVFENKSSFNDLEPAVDLLTSVASLVDTKKIGLKYDVKLEQDNQTHLFNGDMFADLSNVDFNDLNSFNNGLYSVNLNTTFNDINQYVNANYYNGTTFASYNDLVNLSLKTNTIKTLMDYLNKTTPSSEQEPISSISETISDILLKLNIDYNSLLDELKHGNLSSLEKYLSIKTNDDGSLSLLLNLDDSLVDIKINSKNNTFEKLDIINLKINDSTISFSLSFVDYENKLIDETKYYQVDNLLKSGLELTNIKKGNLSITSSFSGEKEFALDGKIQFDVETGDVYGNVDLTAQTALDVNPYTHHVYFDRVPQDNDSLLLAKYYGNDNSSNPMRINMQQKNISAIFDLFNDLPEDHTIQKLMNYIENTASLPILNYTSIDGILNIANGIKKFETTNTSITLQLDKSLLNMDNDLNVIIGLENGNIKSVTLKDLFISSSKGDIILTINDFDANKINDRLSITEPIEQERYFDFNSLPLLLKLGINTSNDKTYYMKGTFKIDIPKIAEFIQKDINYNVTFKIDILDNGKVNGYISFETSEYKEKNTSYRKINYYIDEFDDAYIQRTTYGKEGTFLGMGGTLYKYTDVFKITQQEMMDNMIYYLLKYTFNISNTIYDQLDVFNKSVKSDKKDDEAEVRNFVYENIFKDINYTEKDNGGIFFATIDLNNICNLENATAGFITQKTLNIEIEHKNVIIDGKEIDKLSRLHIYGSPISASLGNWDLAEVKFDLDVSCIYGEFNNNEYIEFMDFYNNNEAITKKDYFYYVKDQSQINSFREKV